jgi:hypothetical protein
LNASMVNKQKFVFYNYLHLLFSRKGSFIPLLLSVILLKKNL